MQDLPIKIFVGKNSTVISLSKTPLACQWPLSVLLGSGGPSPRRQIVTPVINRMEMVAAEHIDTRRPGTR